MSGNRTEDAAMVDEQWRGYDSRAALPFVALAALVTVALLGGRWIFNETLHGILPYAIVLLIWPALLGTWLYRSITYTYRITDRALLVDLGFRHPPIPPIAFQDLASVEHGANWVHAALHIGWVRATARDGRTVKLKSIRDPAAFAGLLRGHITTSVRASSR